MKKIIIISILLLAGCSSDNNKLYESKLKEYGTMYYESYMKNVEGQNTNKISIKDLKNINDKLGESYDLTELSTCDEDSYVEIKVDNNKNIKNYKYHLNCK